MKAIRCSVALIAILLLALSAHAVAAKQDDAVEQQARLRYESGLQFMLEGKYAEALKDFRAVVDSFGKSSVADDALLEIAKYQFENGDLAAAGKAIADINRDHPTDNAAPMAAVLEGRIRIATSRNQAQIDEGIAIFERVLRLHAESDAVPAALYYAGEAQRFARQYQRALDQYSQVLLEHPRSEWARRCELGAAQSLVALGRYSEAMAELQRVRSRFPDSKEAKIALGWNTILFRLYARSSAQPAFAYNSRPFAATVQLKKVTNIAVDGQDNVLVANDKGFGQFDQKGEKVRMPAAAGSCLFLDRAGKPMIGAEGSIRPDGGATSIALTAVKADKSPRKVGEVRAAVVASSRDYIVVDSGAKGIARFSASGSFLGQFAPVETERLAINDLDDVAAIDSSARDVVVFDRSGNRIGGIPKKGSSWEFEDPADVAFDGLGHIYVLDARGGAVLVFGAVAGTQQWKPVATLRPVEKTPGAFKKGTALGLDSAGRLYVYDDDSERVLIFQ